MAKILLIIQTYNPAWIAKLTEALAFWGTLEVTTVKEALSHLRQKRYGLILLETISVQDSSPFIEHIRKLWPTVKVFIITATSDWQMLREAVQAGAVDCIDKSLEVGELRSRLRSVVAASPQSHHSH